MEEVGQPSNTFSELIDQHIKTKGLMQNWIANQLGLSNTFFSRWKKDRFPVFDLLLEFCRLLSLTDPEKETLILSYISARMHPEAKKAETYLKLMKRRVD